MITVDTNKPNAQTHVPETATVPPEGAWEGDGRAPLDTPTLWRVGVKVIHKLTGEELLIHRMDLGTMMFRAYDPIAQKHDDRTMWRQTREYNVKVTLHPDELAKREARKRLDDEIALLDPVELAAVEVLVEGDDPVKGLAKIKALRALKVIKAAPEALAAAVEEKPKPSKRTQAQSAMEARAAQAAAVKGNGES